MVLPPHSPAEQPEAQALPRTAQTHNGHVSSSIEQQIRLAKPELRPVVSRTFTSGERVRTCSWRHSRNTCCVGAVPCAPDPARHRPVNVARCRPDNTLSQAGATGLRPHRTWPIHGDPATHSHKNQGGNLHADFTEVKKSSLEYAQKYCGCPIRRSNHYAYAILHYVCMPVHSTY
jgi:hypothetical protein